MQDFVYHRPPSLADAVAALERAEEGKPLAGGQSLIPLMKLDLAAPSDVVAVRALTDLQGIRRQDGRLLVGAAATHAQVSASAEVRAAIPALAALAGDIGDPQVRNRGTLGGSIAHNDPAADYPAALVALDAVVHTDRRTLAAEDFFCGMFETALEPSEIITGVGFAIPDRACYAKLPNPASRFAIVGVMVARHGSAVRVAVVGAGAGVSRQPAMEQALAADFSPAALDGITVDSQDLVSDMHASAAYRAHLIAVMARRAVSGCA